MRRGRSIPTRVAEHEHDLVRELQARGTRPRGVVDPREHRHPETVQRVLDPRDGGGDAPLDIHDRQLLGHDPSMTPGERPPHPSCGRGAREMDVRPMPGDAPIARLSG
jgi:hypothetical protein